MVTDQHQPRVTLGIATYNRDAYLAEAVESCLAQDYSNLEVLVVVDGSTNPAIDDVLAGFAGDPRLRVVRHQRNLGIAAAYSTLVTEGRGELIAMLGDDDVAMPDRISRQVAIFDRYPDTGVVHGNAVVIDGSGRVTGAWTSADFSPMALIHCFFRRHDYIVDPTRMVHRRVYEQVGGYDDRFAVAQDFEFYLRAARHFRFRHCGGDPLIKLRRHGDNGSDESNLAAQAADVTIALEEALDRYSLRELVPELDWSLLAPEEAERQALLRLADQVEHRAVPTPALARRLRERARAHQPRPRPHPNGRKLLMTMFGFNDSGGGTILPRLLAKELVRRGWEVSVFHAATAQLPDAGPYAVREWEEDGVRLVGIHNRPHALYDIGHPERDLDDPPIRLAFEDELERMRPDVVHFHNLHNLGASLIDVAASHGVPAYFTTHNYWLICPRIYLLDGAGTICAGPGDGERCATCVGSRDVEGHRVRLAQIRSRVATGIRAVLAISQSVRQSLLAVGYPPELVDVVRQSMPHEREIWEQVGSKRPLGRRGEELTVAFLGSAYPHKGPQLLVQAAQLTQARVRVRIHGEVPDRFARELLALDQRGVVDLSGAFAPSEIAGLLARADVAALPSMWWDCANLAAEECHAARLPLLVPRLGGLAETVRDGVDGLTFAGLDPRDLARQLDRLAAEPGLLERLQEGIEPTHDFAMHVDELEAYYNGARPGRVGGANPPAVRWQGDHGLNTSLSIINDRVTARLSGPVQRVAADGARSLDPPLPHAADVEVRHQWPPDLRRPSAGRLAVIQPWEFGAIPSAWIGPLTANVDELWVPSEHVREMYIAAGLAPERAVAIPNGVDLEVFRPDGPALTLPAPAGESATRFLYVGGLIWRKAPDVLLSAWREAFAGRADVTLIVKDFGADGVYRGADRGPIREYAQSGELPRLLLIDDELSAGDLAALYRACDVLVHPYRGEGFAMPVLEAMACGLPVIVTAGGPTDEFCPPEAAWRINAARAAFQEDRVDSLPTVGRPWVLEPDRTHLVALLREAHSDRHGRGRRGSAAAIAAGRLSWDAVTARYEARLRDLTGRPPLLARVGEPEPFPLSEDVALQVLATPAWRAEDQLGALLAEWAQATTRTTSACLYLLADPAVDGTPAEIEAHVLAAAAASGCEIDAGADINVLIEPVRADRDARLHAAVDAYVPLHAACDGHARLAAQAGNEVIELGGGGLGRLLAPAAGREDGLAA